MRRNPLKSGQCFLQTGKPQIVQVLEHVAIPSNRVNVSYLILGRVNGNKIFCRRNPLKSGQCFLP